MILCMYIIDHWCTYLRDVRKMMISHSREHVAALSIFLSNTFILCVYVCVCVCVGGGG